MAGAVAWPRVEVPPSVPPVDADLARRVESADVSYVVARLEWLARRPGNPVGASARRIDAATVLRAARMRTSMFNRVLLADDMLLPRLDDAIAALGGGVAPPRFDVLPPLPSGRLIAALNRRGFECTGHFSGLYGLPRATEPERPSGCSVRRMRDGELDGWIDVYLKGFGITGPDAAAMGDSLRALPGRDESVMLAAGSGGRLVAITALWIHGGTGYVALCATLPEARGRGCQSALIRECLRLSAERGCDLVAAHAAVGSQSQRNFERAGMRLAFHKGLWTRAAPDSERR
jgi:ribosomal protein S18 acetylase RimI-like enzyme